MSPPTLAAIVGLALLAILMPIAIVQRRSRVVDTEPADGRLDPVARRATGVGRPVTVGTIAVGVCLGLWLFVLSVSIPMMLIMRYYIDSWNGR